MGMTLDVGPIGAVMIFSCDPARSANWWSGLIGAPVHADGGFHWLDVNGVEFGFHPADPVKNPVGASTVPYWITRDLGQAIAALVEAGGTLHRGPLSVEPGRRIAQVVDPFGAVIGLEQRP
jgi:predicted enzyme related to lactoylglutathione lyase